MFYIITVTILILIFSQKFIVYKREILSKKLKKILDFSGKYSYDIYLAHMIYVKGALSVIF